MAETMLGATPEQREALMLIDRLRRAGLTDEDIFSGAFGPSSVALGGGFGYLPYATSLAGITSGYNLGRGGLAQSAAEMEYARQQNPYNVVTALQQQADQGYKDPLAGGVLGNIEPGPASRYVGFVDQLLGLGGGNPTLPQQTQQTQQAPAAGAGAPDARTQQTIREAYQKAPQQAEDFFAGAAGTAPRSMLGAMTANQLGRRDTGAQAAASRLLGNSINTGMSGAGFRDTLRAGKVPGVNAITERDFGRLSNDQRGAYAGILASTGRSSNPVADIEDYMRKYRHGGGYMGGVSR